MKRFACLTLLAATLSLSALSHADTPAPSDEALVQSVQQALAQDPELKALELKVSSKNGEVTIDGQMSEDQQMLHAGQIAEKVPGVKFVINNMVMKN